MITSTGICHAKPYTLRGGPSTKLGQRLFKGFGATPTSKEEYLLLSSKLDRDIFAQSVGNLWVPQQLVPPAFVEANYETLESPQRDRRRQMHNKDLQTELEYFSEDYDEEREMEPRPEPARAVTPLLRAASPRVVMKKGKELYQLRRQQDMGTFAVLLNFRFRRYTDDTLQILGLHEDQQISGFIHGLRTRSLVEHHSTDLPLTYNGPMEKITPGSKQERWPLMASQVIKEIVLKDQRNPPRTTTEDRKIKTGQLSHLVKGRKKEKAKSTDIPRGEDKKDKSTAPVEAPILMISIEKYTTKDTVSESMAYKERITFPLVTRVSNALVIIEVAVSERGRTSVHGQRKHMRGYLQTLLRETKP
ncbi:hypothetical protein Tco_1314211 [Tanacetum coccineum]